MKHPACLLALCTALAAAPALADDDCDAPVQHWQPREAVLAHAARQGWQVQRLKIDDGCYEIRGRDAQGRAFKAQLDPETLRVVKMKLREQGPGDGRHKRRRERTRGQGADAPASESSPATSPAASPALTPGTTPRAQIE